MSRGDPRQGRNLGKAGDSCAKLGFRSLECHLTTTPDCSPLGVYCWTEEELGYCAEWYTWLILNWSFTDKNGTANPDDRGPMDEYKRRVESGRLRDDEHQRGEEYWP
jgi:hypothetical protein